MDESVVVVLSKIIDRQREVNFESIFLDVDPTQFTVEFLYILLD